MLRVSIAKNVSILSVESAPQVPRTITAVLAKALTRAIKDTEDNDDIAAHVLHGAGICGTLRDLELTLTARRRGHAAACQCGRILDTKDHARTAVCSTR